MTKSNFRLDPDPDKAKFLSFVYLQIFYLPSGCKRIACKLVARIIKLTSRWENKTAACFTIWLWCGGKIYWGLKTRKLGSVLWFVRCKMILTTQKPWNIAWLHQYNDKSTIRTEDQANKKLINSTLFLKLNYTHTHCILYNFTSHN